MSRLIGLLFTSLCFERMNSIDDYEAMALLDKSINFESNGDSPGPYVDHALGVSASLHGTAPACRNPECLEEAIYRCRAFLRILSTDDLVLCRITEVLADLLTMRSDLVSLEVFKKHVPMMQRSPTSHHSHSLLLLFAPLTRLA